jgi:NAD(P)-dependent dehydrogenase (short-subunit alcohol dehydrogenase family)
MTDARVVLVTGGGSGIGRRIAHLLLGDGDTVVVAGRRVDKLEETIDGRAPGRGVAVGADVADADSVDALFARIREEFGRLDVLVNNAGTFGAASVFDETPVDVLDTVLATNVRGAFMCAQHAFRLMRDQDPRGGRIINIGSLSAQVPRPNTAAYTVAKYAVTGLTRSLMLQGREFEIAWGLIDIGNARTEMSAVVAAGGGQLQPNGTRFVEESIDAGDVAEAARFMARLPLGTTVPFVTVMATQMPFAGRG